MFDKGASLKKTRRIEITAFRRTTTTFGNEPDAGISGETGRSRNDGLRAGEHCSGLAEETDLVAAILSSADSAHSPELSRSIEALVVSKGDGSHAAQQVRFRWNRVLFRLWTLSSSTKSLIAGGLSRIVSVISGLKSPRIK